MAQDPSLGFVNQVIGDGNSVSHQIRSVDLSATVTGTFGSVRKRLEGADWMQFVRKTKSTLIAKLEGEGWSIVFDMKTEPDAWLEYQIILRATKGSETRQIEVVIFPSQAGVSDIAFHEQLSTGLFSK